MAKDLQDTIREILSQAAREATTGVGQAAQEAKSGLPGGGRDGGGMLSGMRGIAAGAGAAALAPVAAKGIGKLVKTVGAEGLDGAVKAPSKAVEGMTSKVGEAISSGVGDKMQPGSLLKGALKSALPFGGGGEESGGKGSVPGVGKGRRMPVQQSVDIGVPLEAAYNQWTQYELWPNFMHRVRSVSQEDPCTVRFATKIWGRKKEFVAQIETQRPDERVKWRVTEGMSHSGVVTFHELGPRLTRVLLGLDVEPGGMLEKAARGMRHVKRAARADLHRFKAFIEMQERETGAWRGVIEDGKVVEEHDASYDRGREYSEFEDAFKEPGEGKQQSDEKPSSRGRSGGRSTSRRSSSSTRGGSRSGSGSTRGASRSGSGSTRGGSRSGSGSTRGGSRSGSGSTRSRSSSTSRNGSSAGSQSARQARSSGGNHSEGRSRSRGRG